MSDERTVEPGCTMWIILTVIMCAATGTCSAVGRIADAAAARSAPCDATPRKAAGFEARRAGNAVTPKAAGAQPGESPAHAAKSEEDKHG